MENPKFINAKGENYLVVQDNLGYGKPLADIVTHTLGTNQIERSKQVKQILVYPAPEVLRRENKPGPRIKRLIRRFTP